ncbi:MAG TPA: glycosyltransferase [Casimicrobiaceae bacterium]
MSLPASLQVSIVTWHPDRALLERTLDHLAVAIRTAQEAGVLGTVHLALVDNSEDAETATAVSALGRARFAGTRVHVACVDGHINLGYGAAHNLVLHGTGSNFHLVLNPDAELAPDALAVAVRWLDAHPEAGALAPSVTDSAGRTQYLCKRYPAILDLLLRGYAPHWLRRLFARRLERYEMRDVVDANPVREVTGVPLMSGAFMLVRREAIDRTGGFDPRFFLYFEDFDWSLRLGNVMKNAWVPEVRVVHHGGGASRKGFAHLGWYLASGWRFYRKHGWKWV